MWKGLAGLLGRLLWSQRNRIVPLSDADLRAIARAVCDGRPFSVVLGDARDRVEELGAKLDDTLDARIVDALGDELLRLRWPAQLDELATRATDVHDEMAAAEARGLAKGRAVRGADDPDSGEE